MAYCQVANSLLEDDIHRVVANVRHAAPRRSAEMQSCSMLIL